MFLDINKKLSRLVILAALLSMNSYASANEWKFDSRKNENCVVLTSVHEKETGKKIADIGMIKLSTAHAENITEFDKNLFFGDIGFVLEKKRRFKTEKGVGVQINSKSASAFMEYTINDSRRNKQIIYISSSLDSFNLVNSLRNDEELIFEFNSSSHEVVYGIVSADNFTQSYDKYIKCSDTLE